MTTVAVPTHLLTLHEWEELPEETYRRAELAEGVLQVSPSPTVRHQVVLTRLMVQLIRATADAPLTVIPDIDVLIDSVFPATIRQPDLTVARGHTATAETRPGWWPPTCCWSSKSFRQDPVGSTG